MRVFRRDLNRKEGDIDQARPGQAREREVLFGKYARSGSTFACGKTADLVSAGVGLCSWKGKHTKPSSLGAGRRTDRHDEVVGRRGEWECPSSYS